MEKLLCILIILTSSTMSAQNIELQKEILLETDRQLSKLSSEKGTLEAFLHFISDDAILFPKFGHPIHGKESFVKIISKIDQKSDYNIPKWKPVFADISKAGDFGYTFGRYELVGEEVDGYQDIKYNYYGSVWKKQKDGNWKIIIHAGLISLDSIDFITEKNMQVKFEDKYAEIVETDKKFSKLSTQKGYLQAFYSYIDDNGLVVSENGQAPANKETYQKTIEYYKKNKPKSELTLSWQPLYADISLSGELGYTHGHAKWITKDAKGKNSEGFSYYLSIWKKQADSSFKFVFDVGNRSFERKAKN